MNKVRLRNNQSIFILYYVLTIFRTRKVVTDFFVHKKSRKSIISRENIVNLNKMRMMKKGSIIFNANKAKTFLNEIGKNT